MERVKADAKLLGEIAKHIANQDVNFASSEFNPIGAITAGFTGVVEDVTYVPIKGRNVTARTAQQGPQIVVFGGKEVILAEVNEMSMTLAVLFKGGKTISLATLNQSPKTKIGAKLIGDITNKELVATIKGKTLKCDKVAVDNDVEVNIANSGATVAELQQRAAKAYSFSIS